MMGPSPARRGILPTLIVLVSVASGCDLRGPPVEITVVTDPCVSGMEGYTFPVCTEPETSEFVGTIDGKPFDLKTTGEITAMTDTAPDRQWYYLSTVLSGGGSLDMKWGEPFARGTWTDIDDGTFVLPNDFRAFRPLDYHSISQVLYSCDDYAFLYILHVWGPDVTGELTGCSR